MKKKQQSLLSLLLVSLLACCLILAGCQSNQAEISGQVRLTGPDGVVLDQQLKINEGSNAADAIIAACQAANLAYQATDGFFESFNGIDSTQTDGWLLYYNDELAQVGSKDIQLEEGFLAEFRYVNYDEAFTLE